MTYTHATPGDRRDRRSPLPVVDAGYESRSIALSSNLHPAGFDAPGHRREGDDATGPMSYGQNPWPPLGCAVGHQRAGPLSVTGTSH